MSKFNNGGHNDVKIPYRVNYIILRVLMAAVSRAVWELQSSQSQEAKKEPVLKRVFFSFFVS